MGLTSSENLAGVWGELYCFTGQPLGPVSLEVTISFWMSLPGRVLVLVRCFHTGVSPIFLLLPFLDLLWKSLVPFTLHLVYSLRSTVYSLLKYNLQSMVYGLKSIVHSPRPTVNSLHFTVYSLQLTVHGLALILLYTHA